MRVRLWVSLGALALGMGLLLTAQLAGASRGFRQGGVFRYGTAGPSVQIDPQLAYVSTAWWLEYATAAKLFNYPDRQGTAGWRLTPEVASRFTVSRDARTYTFVIRRGFRFSDGSRVTAASFKYAIDRVANHELSSPAASFITDPHGTNIVGAKAVNEGHATRVRGVVARGYRLTIRLTHADQTFLTKLAMPFFQATSTKLPLSSEVRMGYPTAGPYFFSRNEPDARTDLRRNTRYGGTRPHNLDGLDVLWNTEQAWIEPTRPFDEQPVPATETELPAIARKYGINEARFWVKPSSCLGMLAFNPERPLFRNNSALRRAVNWAVDRRAYVGTLPPYTATPWTHLLPPGFPGSIGARNLQPYADSPRLEKARRLAAGHLRDGKITVGYRASGTGPARVEVVRRALTQLGFAPAAITLKGFSGTDLYVAMGKRSAGLDLGVSMDWCGYVGGDPTSLLAYFADSGKYHRRLEAARKLPWAARLRALAQLDLALMRDVAPVAVMRTYNNLYLFSDRVDPKSLVYQGVYSDWSIPALALK